MESIRQDGSGVARPAPGWTWRETVRAADDAGAEFAMGGGCRVRARTARGARVRAKVDVLQNPDAGRLSGRWVLFGFVWVAALVALTVVNWPADTVIPIAFVAMVVILASKTKRRMERVVRPVLEAHLDEGFCPACGYNLAGIVAQQRKEADREDALVRCAECGHQWRLARVRRAAVDGDDGGAPADWLGSGEETRRNGGRRVLDARGEVVAVIDRDELRRYAKRRAPDDARLRRAVWRVGWSTLPGRVVRTAFLLGLGVFLLVYARQDWQVGRLRYAMLTTALGALGVWCGWVSWRSAAGNSGVATVRELLTIGRCPVCAERLEEGERVTCGECGSVWERAKVEASS